MILGWTGHELSRGQARDWHTDGHIHTHRRRQQYPKAQTCLELITERGNWFSNPHRWGLCRHFVKYRIEIYSCTWEPFHSLWPHNSNLVKKLFCCCMRHNGPLGSQFCAWHDSSAVMTCANLWRDWIIRIEIKAKWIFDNKVINGFENGSLTSCNHKPIYRDYVIVAWASCQLRKIAGCTCAGPSGNVFPATTG